MLTKREWFGIITKLSRETARRTLKIEQYRMLNGTFKVKENDYKQFQKVIQRTQAIVSEKTRFNTLE